MRNVVLGVVRKILQTFITKLLHYNILTNYKLSFTKYLYFKRNILKNVLPNILFS